MNKNLLIFGNTELAEVSYFYFDKFSDYNIKGFVVDEEYFDSKMITKSIREIWKHIEKKEKFHLKWLFVLMVFTSILPVTSLGKYLL